MDGMRNHAIAGGDSVMGAEYQKVMTKILGFSPQENNGPTMEKETTFEIKEGLDSSRNMFVFIGFIVLVLVLVGLLAYNFLRK